MNPYAQIGLTLGGTALFNLLLGAFIYGQLTEKVKSQGGWLKKHDAMFDEHGKKLDNHERRISHMEGRKGIALDE